MDCYVKYLNVQYLNSPEKKGGSGEHEQSSMWLEAHQGLQSSIKGHSSLHGHLTGLRDGGQTPVQKITQMLLLHIWTRHKPVQII